MITTIRNKLQGTGFRITMGIMLLLIAIVWVMPPVSQVKHEFFGDWIIDINGNKVSYQEFRRKYLAVDQQLQMIRQQYGQYADAFLRSQGIPNDPGAIVLDEITRDALLNYAGTKIPLDISQEFAKEKLKDPAFLKMSGLANLLPPDLLGKDGSVDPAMLSVYLKRLGMSAAQFEAELERALERYMVTELIAMSAHIPSFQLQDAIKSRYARKKFALLSWSIDDLIKKEKESSISDDELQKFYTEQTTQFKRYWVPEKRAGNVWEFSPDTYGIEVSDQEIERYYDRNKSSFVEKPLQIEARRILIAVSNDDVEQAQYNVAKDIEQQLKADPSQFARLAKEHSDDTKSASNGGLMAPFSKGDLDRDFERAIFGLKDDGDIANIFKSKDGFEIVQRIKRIPAQYKSLSSVRDEIRTKLIGEAFKRRFSSDVAKLGKKPHEDALDAFAKEHNATQKGKVGPLADGASAEVRALFTLRNDEISSVVAQNKGSIVQLTEIEKAYLPSFDEIKHVVEQDMYQSKAYQALQDQMKQARADLKSMSLQDIKDRYDLTLQYTGFIDFTKKRDVIAKELQRYKVPADYFMALEKVGSVLEYGDNSAGYLVELTDIEPASEAGPSDADRSNLRLQLYKEEIPRTLESFVASLRGSVKIEHNEQIISKLKDRAS